MHTQSSILDSTAKVFRVIGKTRDNASIACVKNGDYAIGTKYGTITSSHESYFML